MINRFTCFQSTPITLVEQEWQRSHWDQADTDFRPPTGELRSVNFPEKSLSLCAHCGKEVLIIYHWYGNKTNISVLNDMTLVWNAGGLELSFQLSCQMTANPAKVIPCSKSNCFHSLKSLLFGSPVCLICKFSRVESVLFRTERFLVSQDLHILPEYI